VGVRGCSGAWETRYKCGCGIQIACCVHRSHDARTAPDPPLPVICSSVNLPRFTATRSCAPPPPRCSQHADEDLLEYVAELRKSVMEAWTGIIQGWNTDAGKRTAGERGGPGRGVCAVWRWRTYSSRSRVSITHTHETAARRPSFR